MENRVASILLVFILTTSIYGGNIIDINDHTDDANATDGNALDENELSNLAYCGDSVFDVVKCQTYKFTADIIQDVTILVMDYSLTPEEWSYLEDNVYDIEVDIVKYVGVAEINEDKDMMRFEVHSPEQLRDIYTLYDDYNDLRLLPHGPMVLSSIGMIAKNVKIIFMAIDTYGAYYGFDLQPSPLFKIRNKQVDLAYDWIISNKDIYGGIDIISLSFGLSEKKSFTADQSNNLKNEGILLLTSSGNDNTNYNSDEYKKHKYPNIFGAWYVIGAINEAGTRAVNFVPTGGSNWGSAGENDPNNVNFVMPGERVPVYAGTDLGWIYNDGTSFSTPYFAATAAMIIDKYRQYEGNGVDPSLTKLISLLKQFSSRTSFDQYVGWGYIDVFDAYSTLTYVEPSGSGGGCGLRNACLSFD